MSCTVRYSLTRPFDALRTLQYFLRLMKRLISHSDRSIFVSLICLSVMISTFTIWLFYDLSLLLSYPCEILALTDSMTIHHSITGSKSSTSPNTSLTSDQVLASSRQLCTSLVNLFHLMIRKSVLLDDCTSALPQWKMSKRVLESMDRYFTDKDLCRVEVIIKYDTNRVTSIMQWSQISNIDITVFSIIESDGSPHSMMINQTTISDAETSTVLKWRSQDLRYQSFKLFGTSQKSMYACSDAFPEDEHDIKHMNQNIQVLKDSISLWNNTSAVSNSVIKKSADITYKWIGQTLVEAFIRYLTNELLMNSNPKCA